MHILKTILPVLAAIFLSAQSLTAQSAENVGEYIFYASGSTQNLEANINWALSNRAIKSIKKSTHSRHYYVASIDETMVREALPESEHSNFQEFACVLLESYIRSLESCDPNFEVALGESETSDVEVAAIIPRDRYIDRKWGLEKIQAPEAWEYGTGSSSIRVAVVDTGIEYDHQDLRANILVNSREIPNNRRDDDRNGVVDDYYGVNTHANNGNPKDDNGHGTHVAGIIGAVGNNGTGVSGVNWNVKLLPVKFLNSQGRGYTSNSVEGINYAVKRGVHVINASYGSSRPSFTERTAIRRAGLNGVLFVAAAGNSGKNIDHSPSYPAGYGLNNILSVAATNSSDQLERFSNYGLHSVDIAAPGRDIPSTYIGRRYAYLTGTSMAAPFAAGAAALLKSLYPGENYLQLKDRLGIGRVLPSLLGKTRYGTRLDIPSAIGGARRAFSEVKDLRISKFRSRLEKERREDNKLVRNEKFVIVVKGTAGADVDTTLNFQLGPNGRSASVPCQLETQSMPAKGRLVITGKLRLNGVTTKATIVRADINSGTVTDSLRRRVLKPIDRKVNVSNRTKLNNDAQLTCERINRTVRFR